MIFGDTALKTVRMGIKLLRVRDVIPRIGSNSQKGHQESKRQKKEISFNDRESDLKVSQ